MSRKNGRVSKDADREAAERLPAAWKARSRKLGLTQASLARKWGVTPSAVGQYLGGEIVLNRERTIDFARELKIDPSEIRPDMDFNHMPEELPRGDLTAQEVIMSRIIGQLPKEGQEAVMEKILEYWTRK